MKDDDDEDEADGGLHQVQHHPALLHEEHVTISTPMLAMHSWVSTVMANAHACGLRAA